MKRCSAVNKGRHSSRNGAIVKVLVVGQTPPPHGGQAVMIERLVKSELAEVQLIHVRMGFSSHMNEVGRIRISKILHLFGLIARIIYHRFVDGVRILYYPPAGAERVSMFRDIIILLSTRWLFDKTIFHFHAGGVSELYDRLPSWQRPLFRRAYFGADAAIRISELNPEDGMRLAAKRNYVIPNGIIDPCPEMSVSPSNSAATGDDRLRMLFVGILSEAKGVMVLIETCANLAARGVQFELEMMGQWGNDEFAARVGQRINDLNLSSHVRFLGLLIGDDKFAAYRRADVFCLPTFFETFGLVLVEAMACGLPVVSTRCGGIPSVVDEGKTGFLVEPHDPGAVADQLARLAHDPHLRKRMGRAGRAKFEREYTFAHHAGRMRRALLETAGMTVDEAPEVLDDLYTQHPSGTDTADCRSEAHDDAVMV